MAPPFPHSGPDDWYGLMPVKINPAASEYFVYKFREHRRDITPADNVFSSAPTPFLKTEYLAERFDGDEWQVSLVGSGNVLMGVFLLRRR